MKNLLLLLIIFPAFIYGQAIKLTDNLPMKDGKIVYEKTFENLGKAKIDLFGYSKKWMADTFQSANSVIQSEDLNTGQIIGKGIVESTPIGMASVLGSKGYLFSVQLDLKENKARIRIYNIQMLIKTGGYETKLILDNEYKNAKPITGKGKIERAQNQVDTMNKIFESLIESYSNSIEKSKAEDF